jgi:hypothetical protein
MSKLSFNVIPIHITLNNKYCIFLETWWNHGDNSMRKFAYSWNPKRSTEHISVNLFEDHILTEFPILVSLCYHANHNKMLIANLTVNNE